MAKVTIMKEGKIRLEKVRLSYPNLFETAVIKGKDTGKYGATFLIPKKGTEDFDKLEGAFEDLKAEKKIRKIKSNNLLIKDGDEIADEKEDDGKTADELRGMWVVKASTKRKPTVLDKDKSRLDADDERPYAGCYVDVIISLYNYDHETGGKGISANLLAIRFVKDGESLAGGSVATEDDFEDDEEEEDDDY